MIHIVLQNKLDVPSLSSSFDFLGRREGWVVAQEPQKVKLELGHVQLVL